MNLSDFYHWGFICFKIKYVNPNGKEIRTKVESADYSFSKEKSEVRIGNCYIKGDLAHYEIYFKNEEVECKLTLDGSVPSWRPDSGHIYFGEKVLEKYENEKVIERIEAPAMWEQMCFKPDRIK